MHEENLNRVKNALAEFSGKDVEFNFKCVEDTGESIDVYPDLTKFIDMEIEEEEDDIEEDGV